MTVLSALLSGVRSGLAVSPTQSTRCLVQDKRPLRTICQSLLLLAVMALPTSSLARCPDLALVLAIDASGSVGDAEFQLQMRGYSAAFRSLAVQQAIQSVGEVEVAVVLWGDGEMSSKVLPFRDVSSPKASSDLAEMIRGIRRVVTGNTGIGRGLWTALDMIERQAPCAMRQIVNVSGDGKESFGARPQQSLPLSVARLRAEAMDVTVNALAIESDVSDLADWYSENLISGAGAFVMRISGLSSFAAAIEEKLVREISNPMLAEREVADRPILGLSKSEVAPW